MSLDRLETDADIATGLSALSKLCPVLAQVAEETGPVAVRRRPAGFSAVLSTITGQQVSVASAAATWARLQAAGLTVAPAVAAAAEEELRACGLSRQKVRYAKALAESGIDFEDLARLPDEEIIGRLVAVKGVGVWTAEIYAMFALGRPDVFAAGDLALQEAARIAYGLPERPKEAALRGMAEAWRPWRTVAATLLWAYYARVKSREGVR